MGIPGLFGGHIRHIRRTSRFSSIVKGNAKIISGKDHKYYQRLYNGVVSTTSIDMNGLIHFVKAKLFPSGGILTPKEQNQGRIAPKPMSAKEKEEKMNEFKEALWENILLIYRITNPIDSFILAVDGIAPFGKIIQQRRRRFANDSFYNIIFDGNAISPGTEFMFQIDSFLKAKISETKDLLFNCNIIYNSHMVPGEGEHKIFEYIRDENNAPRSEERVHVIFGLDADLIMLSLLSPCPNIILMRETDETESRNLIDDHILADLLEIEILKLYIESKRLSIRDYVFMIMLLGNDFLPHSPSLKRIGESIETLIQIHQEHHYQLISDDDTLNWKDIRRLIIELSKKEFEIISSSGNDLNPNPLIGASFEYDQKKRISIFNKDKFRTLWYNRIFKIPSRGTEQLVLRILDKYDIESVQFEVSEEDIENVAFQYLQTWNWNYLYYSKGYLHVSNDIAYSYDFAPLFVDIANRITDLIKNDESGIPGIENREEPDYFTVLHQLVSVLPKTSVQLVPKPLQFLFYSDSPISDLFPITWEEIMEGTDKKFLAIQRVPIPTRQRIINAITPIVFDAKFISKWLPENDILYQSRKKGIMPPEVLERKIKTGEKPKGKYLDGEIDNTNFRRGRGFSGRGSRGRGFSDRGFRGRGFSDRGFSDRGFGGRGTKLVRGRVLVE